MSIAARRFQRSLSPSSSTATSSPIDDAGSEPVGSMTYAPPGNAIYLATNGSDSNSGSLSSPVATLTRAVALVASGGTIVVRAGSYNDGEDTQDQAYPMGVSISKSVTIQNYPGEAVWFDGSVPVTGSWNQNGQVWSTSYDRIFNRSPTSADGQEDGWGASTGAGGWWTHPDTPQACWPDMVFFDGQQLTQVATLGEVVAGTFFVGGATTTGKWFQGSTLYIGNNPTGHEVRYANKVKLATFAGTGNTTMIRGIGIRRYATYQGGFGAIYSQQTLSVENIVAEDIRCGFLFFDSCQSSDITKLTATRIGFNSFSSNKASYITVDRCDFSANNYAGWNMYGPAIAIMKFNKCQYPTLKNSILRDTDGSGFWVDSTCNTPLIFNCLFKNLTNRPIDYETASDGVIANCKFIHNGADTIFINDSDTTRIYNCVLAENQWGVRGSGGPRGVSTSTSVSPISIGQSRREYTNPDYSFNYDNRFGANYYTANPQRQWTVNYVTICNTVIARPGVNTYDMINSNNAQDDYRAPNRSFLIDMHPTMNGNIYNWSTQPPYPWVCANGYNVNPTVYFSLTSFRSASGQDANSSFTSSDPLDSSYKISNQSYHNNAVPLPADIATMIGQPAGSKRSGAYW